MGKYVLFCTMAHTVARNYLLLFNSLLLSLVELSGIECVFLTVCYSVEGCLWYMDCSKA